MGGNTQEERRLLGAYLALGAVLVAGGALVLADEATALDVNEDVRQSTVWTIADSPVEVLTDVRVIDGAQLIIEPGVEVRFRTGASLQIGDSGRTGNLSAKGTESSPIIFRSLTGASDWDGLEFYGVSTPRQSTLFNVSIRNANGDGLHIRNTANLLMRDVTVETPTNIGVRLDSSTVTWNRGSVLGASSYGLYISGSTLTSTDLLIKDSGKYGVYLTSNSRASLSGATIETSIERPLRGNIRDGLQGITFSGNRVQEVELWGNTITSDVTIGTPVDSATGDSLPVVMLSGTHVRGGATLTIEPGTTLRMRSAVTVNYESCSWWGCSYERGRILAQGTAADPIVFTSDDGARSWGGFNFVHPGSDGFGSLFENVTIERVSGTALTLNGDGRARVVDSTLRDASTHGAYVTGSRGVFERTTFADNGQWGLVASSGGTPVVRDSHFEDNQWAARIRFGPTTSGLTFNGNTFNEVHMYGTTVYGDYELPLYTDDTTGDRLVYRLHNDLQMRGSGILTLAPGTTIMMDDDADLYFGYYRSFWRGCEGDSGGLYANGTAADPITFTSYSGVKDAGILFFEGRCRGAADESPVVLDHVIAEMSDTTILQSYERGDLDVRNTTVRNNLGTGLYLYYTNGRVLDSTFENNDGHGINLVSSDFVLHRNTFTGNDFGVVGDAGSDSPLSGNTFDSNRVALRTKWLSGFRDNTFTDSTLKIIEVWGFTNYDPVTLTPVTESDGTPYEWAFLSDVHQRGNSAMTVPAGTNIDLRGNELRAGYSSSPCSVYCGDFIAVGTPTDPVTIRNGRLLLDGWSGSGPVGTLEHVVIKDAPDMGLYIHYVEDASYSKVTLENNHRGLYQYRSYRIDYDDFQFLNNRQDGAEFQSGGDAVVHDSVFDGNARHAVYSNGVYVTLHDNQILDSGSYGVYFEGTTGGDVYDNVIDGTGNRPMRVPLQNIYQNTVSNVGFPGILINGGDLQTDLTLVRQPFGAGVTYTYHFVNHATVRGGATLTIEPGQTLLFNPSMTLRFGDTGTAGGLIAEGTGADPITFTSTTRWNGLYMDGRASPEVPSRLTNVLVERVDDGYGGIEIIGYDDLVITDSEFSGQEDASGIWATDSAFTMTGSLLADNGYHGLYLTGSASPTLTDNVFSGNQYGMYATGGTDPTFTGNTFEDNSVRGVGMSARSDANGNTIRDNTFKEIVLTGGDIYDARTLRNVDNSGTGERMTFVVVGDIRVFNSGALTIEPGATLRFTADRDLILGTSGTNAGTLTALGTPAEPITFTSYTGLKEWDGITIDGRRGNRDAVSTLTNIVVEKTRNQAMYFLSHNGVTLTDATIQDTSGDGMYLDASSPTIDGLVIRRVASDAVDVRSSSGASFTGLDVAGAGGYGFITDHGPVVSLTDSRFVDTGSRPVRITVRSTLGADVTFADLEYPQIELLGNNGGTVYAVSADRTLPKLVNDDTGDALPYIVLSRVDVRGGTLTLEAGVEMRFVRSTYQVCGWRSCTTYDNDQFYVGSTSEPGALVAQGTAADPVILSGDLEGNTWAGLRFEGRGGGAGSVLDHVIVDRSYSHGIYAYEYDDVTVRDSTGTGNVGNGLRFDLSDGVVERFTGTGNTGNGVRFISSSATLADSTLTNNAVGGAHVSGVSTPLVEGNSFSGNTAAGFLASDDVTPVLRNNAFSGGGRAIGVADLATPLDVEGGDAGDAGILNGLFQPQNGGTNWFYITPVAFGSRSMTLNIDGPAGSSLDVTLHDRFADADFTYKVFATDDGREVQSELLTSNGNGDLDFTVLIDGSRRAEIDVVPVVDVLFTYLPSAPTVELAVGFLDTSSVLYADVVEREWEFGDGTAAICVAAGCTYFDAAGVEIEASLDLEPTHQFLEKRSYRVNLTLTLDTGRTYQGSDNVLVVNAAPHAEFSFIVDRPDELDPYLERRATILDEIAFTDESFDTDGFIIPQFTAWDFGDGEVSADEDPVHTYAWPGEYDVCLTVMDDDFVFDTNCHTVTVWGPKTLTELESRERVNVAVDFSESAEGLLTAQAEDLAAEAEAVASDVEGFAATVPGTVDAQVQAAVAEAEAAHAAAVAEAASAEASATTHALCMAAAAELLADDPSLTPAALCAAAAAAEAAARADDALATEVTP